ncbi:hypothetical protein HOLleu_21686 [Holothuria leucospilota]|uniref:Ig-like domain-containing protein n=1 Tax=Holothuria leucospilota TaxID=206669 RepID=A0A9Q1H6Z8_HOLLE|nr:hypothetical protein HOLleu_21686 [Holothuria leucospilota]
MACDLSTGRMMFLFTWLGILLLPSVSLGKTGSLRCPTSVQVELGTDGLIECAIGFKYGNLYWYSGDTFSETPPIVRLENGVPEGGDGFDITHNGSLVVLSADVSLEGTYTIVVFHLNNTYEHSSTSLKTFANPKPHFPLFQRCKGGQNCFLKADGKGSVQCSINGARPAFELNLQSEGVMLVNVTNKNVTDKSTGLTDTTAKAYYESAECVQLSNITCIATGLDMQELKSTLTFHDKCSPINPTGPTGKSSAGAAVVITLVIIVIIVIAVVVTIYFIRKRRDDYEREKKSEVKVTNSDNDCANAPLLSKKENSDSKKTVKENKEILLDALCEKYLSDYFGTSRIGNDRIISIDDVYIDTEFELKDDNGETSTFLISDILKKSFINDGKMRLFVSNKMQITFSSHLAYLWSEQKTKDNILLVFNMQDVSYHTTIATALKEMLQDRVPLTEDDLIKIIEEFGCHIIVEGVELKRLFTKRKEDNPHEVAVESQDTTSLNTDNNVKRHPPSKWTIDNVLRDYKREILHPKISHWVVTFDYGCTTAKNLPYDLVKMKDLPLFTDRIDDYIQNVIEYYYRDTSDEDKQKLYKVVQEVLLNCDIKNKFGKAVVLFLQIIHLIITQCITNDETCNYMSISSLLMKSLALLKVRYGKKFPTKDKDNLTTFEEQLGEVALNQETGSLSSQTMLSEDVVDFSKSIGLIKQSSAGNKITFNVEEGECFLVASFLRNTDKLSNFIDGTISSEDYAAGNKRFQVLSFICALQPSLSREICEMSLKKGKLKYFLNCFCETTNADEFHESIKKYFEKEDCPIFIYSDKPHLAKTRCLLKYCKKWKIKVHQVIFEKITQKIGNTSVVETDNFEMPAVKKLTFNRIQLEDEESMFVYYIEWILKQNIEKVSFDNCRLPEFSPEITFSLKTAFIQSKSNVVIQKTEIQGNMEATYVLNKEKIKWDKKGGKAYKKKDKDAKGGHQDKKQDKEEISSEKTVKQKQENKKTKQAPDKPPRAGTTDNKLGSGQSDLAAGTTDDIQSEVNTSNDVEPFKDKELDGESKDVSVSATNAAEKEGTDFVVESKVDRDRNGQPSEVNTSEPKDNWQVSRETDVPSTGSSDVDNLIKDGSKDTAKSEGNKGDPSAK